jgi:hypothetical protein
MTTDHMPLFGSDERYALEQSLRGLDWFNFFLAGMLSGFGPFVARYLASRGWTQVEIGFVLTRAPEEVYCDMAPTLQKRKLPI